MLARRMAGRLMAAVALVLVAAGPVQACGVCFGDPDSRMTKGAAAGVLFMVILTYTLLLGLGGMTAFWTVRARRLRRKLACHPAA